MLVHSGERPYKCTVCGQSFTTNGNMHRWVRACLKALWVPGSLHGVVGYARAPCSGLEASPVGNRSTWARALAPCGSGWSVPFVPLCPLEFLCLGPTGGLLVRSEEPATVTLVFWKLADACRSFLCRNSLGPLNEELNWSQSLRGTCGALGGHAEP